jgi:hypothetical protein
LALLAVPSSGLTTAELAAELDVPDRRTRKITAALRERGEVVIVDEPPGPRRVWLVEQRKAFLAEQRAKAARKEWMQYLLHPPRRPPRHEVHCPNCGAWVQTHI